MPPDLSLITKAREGGADYVYAILTGYKDPPPGFKLMPGMYYNEYFPGHQIAMPPPLNADQVTFADRHAGDGAADVARRRQLPDLGGGAEPRSSGTASASR